jgi:hypothetical protein
MDDKYITLPCGCVVRFTAVSNFVTCLSHKYCPTHDPIEQSRERMRLLTAAREMMRDGESRGPRIGDDLY